MLRQSLPETSDDKRLDAVLKCLLEHHEAGSYRPSTNPTDNLRVEDLTELSKKSFPPCMRRLHEALITKHHLRHGGRQQYQLFLKGAGLPMEETLRFWRAEFLKVMAPEKVSPTIVTRNGRWLTDLSVDSLSESTPTISDTITARKEIAVIIHLTDVTKSFRVNQALRISMGVHSAIVNLKICADFFSAMASTIKVFCRTLINPKMYLCYIP